MKTKKLFLTVLTVLFCTAMLITEVPSTDELYRMFDSIFESFNHDGDISFTITIIDEKPNKPKVASQYKTFRRDRSDQTVLLQIAPEIDKGMGYLQDGDNIWTYDPNTRQFDHYSIKQNLGDSSVKIRDVNTSKKFKTNYEILTASETTVGKIPVYKVETKPIYKDAEYAKETYYVSKADKLIVKQEFYGASGRLMRTFYMTKYEQIDTMRVPVQQISINNVVQGEKSTLIMSGFNTNALPDMIFTKAYLEKVN